MSTGEQGRWRRLSGLWRRQAFAAMPLSGLAPNRGEGNARECAPRWIAGVEVEGRQSDALLMLPGERISYRLQVPRGAEFQAAVSLLPRERDQGAAVAEFEVSARRTEHGHSCPRRPGRSAWAPCRAQRVLVQASDSADAPRWRNFRAALGDLAGEEIDLTLSVLPSAPAGADEARAVWGAPAVIWRKPWTQIWSAAIQYARVHGLRGFLRRILGGTPAAPPTPEGAADVAVAHLPRELAFKAAAADTRPLLADDAQGKRVLVMDDRTAEESAAAGGRTEAMVGLLAEAGCVVTLVKRHVEQAAAARLTVRGAEVFGNESYRPHEVIAARTGLYDTVIVGPGARSLELLNVARQWLPDALLVFDAAGLPLEMEAAPAPWADSTPQPAGTQECRGGMPIPAAIPAGLGKPALHLTALRDADVVIAASDAQRQALAAELTHAAVTAWDAGSKTQAAARELVPIVLSPRVSHERAKRRWRRATPTIGLTWGAAITGDDFILAATKYGAFGPDKALLELGPGFGRLLASLLNLGLPFRRYVGVDISDDNIGFLRQNFQAPNLEFVLGDFENTVPPGEFDAVCASLTLKHLYPSFEAALRHLSQSVKSGGLFIFDLIEADTPRRFFEADGVTYIRHYTRNEVEEILRTAGLELVAFDTVRHSDDPQHARLLVVARKP